jgi:cardiolipin synthase (CMP-forming)
LIRGGLTNFFNPANLATLARLALAPGVALAIFHSRHVAALALFFVLGLTDGIDGPLARRFGWVTAAGAYLDPIADKVLLSTVYICLALRDGLPWWFVAVVFGRDVLILLSAGAALMFTSMRKFQPSVWGKFSTFLQIVAAIAWLSRPAFPCLMLDSIAALLLWPATAATLWSGIHYAWRGAQQLQ